MMEKRKCKFYDVCGLYAEVDDDPALCILHSKDPNKNRNRFKASLAEHRREKAHNLRGICFPDIVDFSWATFSEEVDFSEATFSKDVDFSNATFVKGSNFTWVNFFGRAFFSEAKFKEGAKANFVKAIFHNWAVFIEAEFSGENDFSAATFYDDAVFILATFTQPAEFYASRFCKQASFSQTKFTEGADFSWAGFLGRTEFIGREKEDKKVIPIFSSGKGEVNFTGVSLDSSQKLIFRNANLTKCILEQTDLRKVELTGVIWPKTEEQFRTCGISWQKPIWRYLVYDEIRALKKGETRKWEYIERIYRELKQNYEDCRDYERAGDFHYGEKEMRRRNPSTSLLLKFLLTLYCWASGYGERYVRPLVWAFGLMVVCTVGYLYFGIETAKGGSRLALENWKDWFRVGLYSLQVMALLKPAYFIPLGTKAIFVKFIQSVLGPLFFGLFALAVRQRLKR